MNIRSFMAVNEGTAANASLTLYVLVEGAMGDCAVYMEKGFPADLDVSYAVRHVARGGNKVSIRDIDALPFKIPSDLRYRA